MPPRGIYFAHPINTYDTRLETQLIDVIRAWSSDARIVNPNAPQHTEAYKLQGMTYFAGLIERECDELVLLAFRDGMIGAGVYAEAVWAICAGLRVWEISPEGRIELWTEDPSRRLTVQSTRERVRCPYIGG